MQSVPLGARRQPAWPGAVDAAAAAAAARAAATSSVKSDFLTNAAEQHDGSGVAPSLLFAPVVDGRAAASSRRAAAPA